MYIFPFSEFMILVTQSSYITKKCTADRMQLANYAEHMLFAYFSDNITQCVHTKML